MKTEISEKVARMLMFDWMDQYCANTNEMVEREIGRCVQGKEFNSAPSDLAISYSKEQWWLDTRKGD